MIASSTDILYIHFQMLVCFSKCTCIYVHTDLLQLTMDFQGLGLCKYICVCVKQKVILYSAWYFMDVMKLCILLLAAWAGISWRWPEVPKIFDGHCASQWLLCEALRADSEGLRPQRKRFPNKALNALPVGSILTSEVSELLQASYTHVPSQGEAQTPCHDGRISSYKVGFIVKSVLTEWATPVRPRVK